MANSEQHWGWISRRSRIAASAALAFALILGVAATPSAQAQTFTVLYSFTGGADGAEPYAGLIRDKAGNLYGTTLLGGYLNYVYGYGVVFKVDTSGNETVLYSFTGGTDGGWPQVALLRDNTGNLYGTTGGGGDLNCTEGDGNGCGTVFKVDTSGTETVLYGFTGPDGALPSGGLVRDAAGNLYGITGYGGASGSGTVFKVDTNSTETLLYGFCSDIQNCMDGGYPEGSLALDKNGNLYGTTRVYGDPSCDFGRGCGVVFKSNTAGGETVLYSFGPAEGHGDQPRAGVIRDGAGNLYGTTNGGSRGGETVFEVAKTGKEKVLYRFRGGTDGGDPVAGVVRDKASNLYGTTLSGGAYDEGTIFRVNKAGRETVLYSFCSAQNCADGNQPYAGVVRDTAGNLYGTTQYGGVGTGCGKYGCGTVWKLSPR